MSHLNSTQRALASGQAVIFARLVDLELDPDPLYLWEGLGPIAISGHTYLGAGTLMSIAPIGYSQHGGADKIELGLSGVDSDVVALARDAGPLSGIRCTIWGQLFTEALNPSGGRFWLGGGTTDIPRYSASGATRRQVTISVEGDFTERNRAAFASMSDRDQQARFAGDMGLEFVATMNDRRIDWPF